ncbi:hypothetical protein COT64_03660 [Candidatus Shapirobacteria bacterium CG09_land_8_20_14_0_10_39_12]|uniref:Sodium/calcium exchanger membrane region domain-containing protein n=1 Tax=Candidatus Shapirobacteria bacterium CG09_land_8_20_14_0_10_39_12 TaxID=1974885 RepID=A0A2H0WNL4_9BACT|nr:MAG: hypothetical protein COT64_03660 [Candidatus Shapirobacteria bacterium CG09_land_8_20_14_0_10_39_12]
MVIFFIILICLFALIKSADIFVNQASALAKKLKMGNFTIGFTVVAFGTSLPELVSTLFSSISGHNQLVVANIIGSNMANLCLIFGLIAVFHTYRIRKRDVDINIPLNITALIAFWALSAFTGFVLNWTSGAILILLFLVLMLLSREYNHLVETKRRCVKFNLSAMMVSLVLLVLSGKICIDQIIGLSQRLLIAETILGYFLLAIGTSLPEMVTTWTAVKKNSGELGVGNVLGSNLFNLLFILGVSTFIGPIPLSGFIFDLVFLTGAALLIYIFAVKGKKYSFSKKEGFALLFFYTLFAIIQVFKNL